MCGICGFNFEDLSGIKEMAKQFDYRGPDQENYYTDNAVSLGHKRLSIIDLSEKGRQPMCNESKDIWIVFNGEIYNYNEIRPELERKGHVFNSQSDTEVIIHAYEEYGKDCVKMFNGMWAFCIYDKRKSTLFLSRDRFGKKPLYYSLDKDKFYFSSEIKGILKCGVKKELNKPAVSSYLSYRYVLGEETFFKNIYKVLPGHNMIFNLKTRQIEENGEYWDIPIKEVNLKEEEILNKINDLLKKSVMYRKISDVPLGVILSGGLDSSIITAILAKQEQKPINTFTVKFKETGYDETEFAKIVADLYKTNYFEVTINTDNFLKIMKEYMMFKDEPVGVPNEIPLYLLSKKIKEKVTVVLSGEGADEFFEGYGRIFSSARDYEIIKQLQGQKNGKNNYKEKYPSIYNKYKGVLFKSELEHFLFMYNYWGDEEKNFILLNDSKKDFSAIFKKYIEKNDLPYEKKISYIFMKLHLPGLLNRLDSSTMANSVEGRAPFLDYKLAEFVFNIPLEYKTKWLLSNEELLNLDKNCDELSEKANISKYILKEMAKEYLPETIVKRKKQGFPLPLNSWFKNDFLNITKEMLLDENSKIKEVINQENLANWIEKGQGEIFGQKLWMLLSLEMWLREWF
jgi:asparagine synthase (glutamine-hydrolysing)